MAETINYKKLADKILTSGSTDLKSQEDWRAAYDDFRGFRDSFQGEISKILEKLNKRPTKETFDSLHVEIEKFLKKNFRILVPSWYNNLTGKSSEMDFENNTLKAVLNLISHAYVYSKVTDDVLLKRRIAFLEKLVEIIKSHGLHPTVFNRPSKYMCRIEYKQGKGTPNELRYFDTLLDLELAVLRPFKTKQAILINGVLIQQKDLIKITIWKTPLKSDEVYLYATRHHSFSLGRLPFSKIKLRDYYFDEGINFDDFELVTNELLEAPYTPFSISAISEQYSLKQLEKQFPEIYLRIVTAIQAFEVDGRARPLVDELRLSLELMLREILGNDKSMENQDKPLKDYFDSIDGSGFVRNLFMTAKKTYQDIQNNNVKHDDCLSNREFYFLINLHFNLLSYIVP